MYSIEIQRYTPHIDKWETMNASPIYGEDIDLSITRESGERYCRYDVDGTFTFIGNDFTHLIETIDPLRMNIYWKEGSERLLVASAPFTREDLECDFDNGIATLQLQGKDQYEDFLEAMDAEYDLVQLAPPRKSVELYKRAFLQLYVQGDTKLTNVLGNMEYEVDAKKTVTSGRELMAMNFSNVGSYIDIEFKAEPTISGLSVYNGNYRGDVSSGVLKRTDGKFQLKYGTEFFYYEWVFMKIDGTIPSAGTLHWSGSVPGSAVYTTIEGEMYGGSIRGVQNSIWARGVSNTQGSEITTDDIWEKNLNYRYTLSLDAQQVGNIQSRLVISYETTTIPNKWGTNDAGKYFLPPQPSASTDRVIAIGWSRWSPMSIWLKNNASLSAELTPYDEQWTLKDAYSIQDAIKVLLKKIDPSLTLRSWFLDNSGEYAEYNPILGGGKVLYLYITPVTNIKKTQYEQAAQKGKISLKQIMDMLKKCFNCYWYLEWVPETETWRMRIEHAEYFRHGGEYAEAEIPVPPIADLSQEFTKLSKKPWITDQNKMSYDLDDVKSRYEFEWGDKSTALFNGFPLISTDRFAKGKPVEKVQISNFMADIDIIESSPESVSDDIFVVIGTDENDMVYYDRVSNKINPDSYPIYLAQNSMLSFYSLEQNFLNYEKTESVMELEPRYDTEGNQVDVKALISIMTPQRIIRQSIRAPFIIRQNDIAPEKIETGNKIYLKQGTGQIESIKMNLFTESADIELLFEPNEDY